MKKLRKDIMALTAGGLTMGIGAQVAGAAGSPQAASAIGNVASFMPVMGTAVGAGATLRALKKIKQPKLSI